jgi:small subunit ribosomal protein S11
MAEKEKKSERSIEKIKEEKESSKKVEIEEKAKKIEKKLEEKESSKEKTKTQEEKRELKKDKGTKGIVRIYSSKNNTIVHITDITGAETISRVTGGMITKADRLKGAPYQGMLIAQRAVEEAKSKGITELDIKIRAPGSHKQMNTGKGAQPAIKAILKSGLKVNVIEDVTPIIHGYMRRRGGRRGRRL